MALSRALLLAALAGAGACHAAGEEPVVEARLDRERDDFGVVVVRHVDARNPPSVEVRAGDADAPPLAGALRFDGDSIRFVPRFPPGDVGSLRVSVGGAEHRFTVSAPEIPASTTELVAVHPSAGEIPANQLRWYLEFSAPMREGDAARHVRLVDSAGREVPDAFLEVEEELWDPSRRRLTLLFDMGRVKRGIRTHEEAGAPLESGRRYALVVDSAWRDARGAPLRHGIVHRFRALRPDRSGPEPSAWRVAAPAAGTRDPLDVQLDGALDHAMGERLIGVWRDGRRVEGSARLSDADRRWWFTPVAAWTAGRYELRVSAALEDPAGNSVARAFELPADSAIRGPVARPEIIRFALRSGG